MNFRDHEKRLEELKRHHDEVLWTIWECFKVFATVWTIGAIISALIYFLKSS